MDSPVLWCSLPQILPSFLIYLRNVGLIAATAKYYDYTLVTRNEKDFDGIDITIFNPFKIS